MTDPKSSLERVGWTIARRVEIDIGRMLAGLGEWDA
jgi:hypothetical protein